MKTEYANLDFLRAVAVTLVTVCHVCKFFGISFLEPWGPYGVAIFFVHTSLVLTQSLDFQEPRHPLYVPFMIRRCFRIYPLAIVILSIVVLFRIPQLFPLMPDRAGRFFGSWNYRPLDVVANFFLVQELKNTRTVTSIIAPMWSLSVEMVMYVVLPLLFLLVNRKQRRGIALAGMYLLVVMLSAAGVRQFPFIDFFMHAPVFAAGIVTYYLLRRHHFVLPAFCWPLALIAACVVLPLPWVLNRIPLLYWGLGVAAAIPWFAQLTSRHVVLVSKLIARYSYGVYLTHCLCMWMALEKTPGPALLRIIVFFILLVTLSVALYHGIEQPLIRVGKCVAARYVGWRKQRQQVPALSAGLRET